jgi:hypothetical protein
MSTTKIYFLTEAEDIDQAEHNVSAYLDTENFFDSFSILPESSGLLSENCEALTKFIGNRDWRKNADDFLNLAERYKAAGYLDQYGYHLINAGQLYSQNLMTDTLVYNISTTDYSIPLDDKGWWLIAVHFHY